MVSGCNLPHPNQPPPPPPPVHIQVSGIPIIGTLAVLLGPLSVPHRIYTIHESGGRSDPLTSLTTIRKHNSVFLLFPKTSSSQHSCSLTKNGFLVLYCHTDKTECEE